MKEAQERFEQELQPHAPATAARGTCVSTDCVVVNELTG